MQWLFLLVISSYRFVYCYHTSKAEISDFRKGTQRLIILPSSAGISKSIKSKLTKWQKYQWLLDSKMEPYFEGMLNIYCNACCWINYKILQKHTTVISMCEFKFEEQMKAGIRFSQQGRKTYYIMITNKTNNSGQTAYRTKKYNYSNTQKTQMLKCI